MVQAQRSPWTVAPSTQVADVVPKEIKVDDDQDSVWMSVDIGGGASCHVGYRSCFYRSIPLGKINNEEKLEMKFTEKKKFFDPKKVYKDEPNPPKL